MNRARSLLNEMCHLEWWTEFEQTEIGRSQKVYQNARTLRG
jgi:hypothetical protein